MEVDSIYKVCRAMKKREQSLYNALRSIYHDSLFVQEIAQLWPCLPLLANLRCGAWYAPSFHGVCYFKSTDGHNGNWSFNVTRLNLHVAVLAGPFLIPLSPSFNLSCQCGDC
jgi:tRNA A64-2'-O-ribosylphosphate transferase